MTKAGLLLVVLAFVPLSTAVAEDDDPEGEVARLRTRVATLERQLAELRVVRENDRLLNRLRGRWVERSRLRGGESVSESEETLWRLEDAVNSERYVLAAVVDTTEFGRMSVDGTKSPAWIDFTYEAWGRTTVWRGLVEVGFEEVTIVLPHRKYEAGRFSEPPRPTSFESTEENGHSVYHLVRRDFVKTGW